MDLRFVIFSWIISSFLLGCKTYSPALSKPFAKSNKMLVVATSNNESGALAILDIENRLGHLNVASIYMDSIVKLIPESQEVFVINRLGADNIQRISLTTGLVLQQFSLGLGSNPQDMVIDGENAFISCLQVPEVLKINLKTGQIVSRINLRRFSDEDGSPEATKMIKNGSELWIQLQNLDKNKGYVPTAASQIVVVDLAMEEVVDVFHLKATNPNTQFKIDPRDGTWLVGEVGWVGSKSKLDGGIERIDPNLRQSLGFMTTEAQLGGDIVDFECLQSGKCIAIVSKPQTELVEFDLLSGVKTRILWSSTGFDLRQIIHDPDEGVFYVADANPLLPKIRVWDEKNLIQQTHLNWDLELPPAHMELSI